MCVLEIGMNHDLIRLTDSIYKTNIYKKVKLKLITEIESKFVAS